MRPDVCTTDPASPDRHRVGGHRARRAVAAGAVLAVLALGACSSDGSDGAADDGTTTTAAASTTAEVTTTSGAASTTAGGTSTSADTTSPDTAPPTEPPATTSAPPEPLTSAEAETAIGEVGAWDPAMETYDPAAELSAVEAVAAGAASSAAPEQIFFFSQGRYLGTATSEPRAGISITGSEAGAVTVSYSHWDPADPFCCPSLDPWVVTFRLVEGVVTPEGELPPEDQGLG